MNTEFKSYSENPKNQFDQFNYSIPHDIKYTNPNPLSHPSHIISNLSSTLEEHKDKANSSPKPNEFRNPLQTSDHENPLNKPNKDDDLFYNTTYGAFSQPKPIIQDSPKAKEFLTYNQVFKSPMEGSPKEKVFSNYDPIYKPSEYQHDFYLDKPELKLSPVKEFHDPNYLNNDLYSYKNSLKNSNTDHDENKRTFAYKDNYIPPDPHSFKEQHDKNSPFKDIDYQKPFQDPNYNYNYNTSPPKHEINYSPEYQEKNNKPIEKEISSPLKDFKSQLPHNKEKTHNLKVVANEDGKKQAYPKFIESRVGANIEQNEKIRDKGFYNEGITLTKEPPKKVNFNINYNGNPFGTSMTIEEVQKNATFSKHIFEDKTIIEVLEKKNNMGRSNIDPDLNFMGNTMGKKNILMEKNGKTIIEKAEHHSDPYARFAHIILKLITLLAYLSLSSSSSSANVVYQCVIILSALDFWMVKNVTGRFSIYFYIFFIFFGLLKRMLIGYRYWCEFNQQGKERWVFETYCERNVRQNKINTRFFWIIQMVFCLVWFFYAFYELFNLKIAMFICLILGFLACFGNLMIFRRCQQIKKNHMEELFIGMSHLDRTLYMIRGSIKLPLFKNKAFLKQ